MAKTPYVDKDECTACNQCIENLPEVFTADEDDLAEVIEGWEADEEDIDAEIEACPGECIHWKEA